MRFLAAAFAAVVIVASANGALAADAVHGGQIFNSRCMVCHTVTNGGPNKIGPNLFGIVGRHSASVAGFVYSPAMKASGLTWTAAQLRIYLTNPAKTVPGNRMAFAGITDSATLDDLIAYLGAQH